MTERKNLAQRVLAALAGKPAGRTESGFRAKITEENERRKYRRIEAAVYCRPAGLKFLSKHEEPIDVSLGGVRVYSDLELQIGERLTMELFLKGQPSVHFDAEVAWIEPLAPGAPGKFDVGLKFVHVDPEAEALLAKVLE
jgi:hypothetical protein